MRNSIPVLAVLAVAVAPPASAVPGGRLGTLTQGTYVCELPGDAGGPTRIHVEEADFRIVSASSYRAGGVMGSYLRTGDRVVMTSGPHRGKTFHRVSEGFLRLVAPDGSDGPLRCILTARKSM